MDLRQFDLNLLRVLDMLLAERHVTRAARRLGLTQSAVSNALRRLRDTFGDDLFQRTPTGMAPTAVGLALAAPVREALAAVEEALSLNRPFDPASARDRFVIGLSEQAELNIGVPLIDDLAAAAPGVSVTFHHIDRKAVFDFLDQDQGHLALGMLPEPPNRFTRIILRRDPLVAVVRRGHPLLTTPATGPGELDAFLAYPHLLVSAVASRDGAVDRALTTLGRERHLAAVVSHTLAAAALLAAGERVAVMPRGVAEAIAAPFGLVLVPVPAVLDLAAAPTHLLFHRRYEGQPAHRWLRRRIGAVARGASAPVAEGASAPAEEGASAPVAEGL